MAAMLRAPAALWRARSPFVLSATKAATSSISCSLSWSANDAAVPHLLGDRLGVRREVVEVRAGGAR
jgi:hypothetical protein